uniref:Guanine nucleotide-binding protein subunit beta-like protein n=1 Tax=Alexandrium catenella TaxID=2925 RepID=A0A7S1L984_ALECA
MGTSVIGGFESGAIHMWDTIEQEPSVKATIAGDTRGGCSLCLAPLSSSRVASGHIGDSLLRIWDPKMDHSIAQLRGHGGAIRAVTALPGGGLGSGSQDGTVKIWEPVPTH